MTIYEHVESLAGKPVVDWDPAEGIKDPESTIYCVSLDNDDAQKGVHWTDRFAQMLDDPASARLTGLVVGPWGFEFESGSAPVVAELVAACDRLPNLTVLFVGDIISEESEISWIEQSDVTPLLEAYPALVSPRLVKVATLAPRPRCGGVTQPNGRRPRRLLTRSTPPRPAGLPATLNVAEPTTTGPLPARLDVCVRLVEALRVPARRRGRA